MWIAELVDGLIVDGKKSNFLDIAVPIQQLSVPSAGIIIKDCAEYFMAFHAVAVVGQQGRVESIEVGGLFQDGLYHGLLWTRDRKRKEIIYEKDQFPFGAALKPGIMTR